MSNTNTQKTKYAGVVVTILALFFTVHEYRDRLEQSKVNRSFQFYDNFRSGELLNTRARLHSRINEVSKRGNLLSGEEMDKVMIDTLTNNQDSIDYDIVLEFFDAAYECFLFGGCDEKTVVKLLGNEAHHLLIPIFAVIRYRAESNIDHAIGLKYIAREYKLRLPEEQNCTVPRQKWKTKANCR